MKIESMQTPSLQGAGVLAGSVLFGFLDFTAFRFSTLSQPQATVLAAAIAAAIPVSAHLGRLLGVIRRITYLTVEVTQLRREVERLKTVKDPE